MAPLLKHYKIQLSMVIIIIFALCLRLWGIDYSLPFIGGNHPDEPAYGDWAIELVQKDMTLSQLHIGHLYDHVLGVVVKLYISMNNINPQDVSLYKQMAQENNISCCTCCIAIPYQFAWLYYWGRVTTTIFAVLTVLIVYLIGVELKSVAMGLTAAFFIATLPLHVEFSKTLLRTIPGLFFIMMGFYVIVLAYNRHSWLLYLPALVLVILAVLTKQNGLILIVPLMVAMSLGVYQEARQGGVRQAAKTVGVIAAIIVIVVVVVGLVTNLFNIFQLLSQIYGMIFKNEYFFFGYQFGQGGQTGWQVAYAMIKAWYWSYSIIVLGILGIYPAIRLKNHQGWILLSVPILYLVMVSSFSLLFDHWLLPPLSFIAIVAALALDTGFEFVRRRQYLTGLYFPLIYGSVVLMLAVPAIYRNVYMAYNQSLADPRNQASLWMEQNLPPDSTVVIDRYGPFLSQENHHVIYQNSVLTKDITQYQSEGVSYIVGNSLNFTNLIQARSDPTINAKVEEQLMRANIILTQLVYEKEFSGGFGLTVRIYKVP